MLKRPTFATRFTHFFINKLLKNKHKTNEITLRHNTIYVLPSRLGAKFLFVALLNFVMGINYQNNLILAMAYLMVVLLVFAILTGYKNLRGLSVKFNHVTPCYAPNQPSAHFSIKAKSACQGVALGYKNTKSQLIDVGNNEVVNTHISLNVDKRGRYCFEKVQIYSSFPFGLVSVWSYIQPSDAIYIYPEPIDDPSLVFDTLELGDSEEHESQQKPGSDDFHQLSPFIPGTALNKVSWKHYAKTQQLLSKEFTSHSSAKMALNFNKLNGNTETRLSQLCYLVNKLTEQHVTFSLTLPNSEVASGYGLKHQKSCLQALAEF